jgi:hypothetical protein
MEFVCFLFCLWLNFSILGKQTECELQKHFDGETSSSLTTCKSEIGAVRDK